MGCTDARLTYLNNLGYNVVRLPRTGIEPLDVFGKKNKAFERLGKMPQIWGSTAQPPVPDNNTAGGITGTKTDKLKVDVGIDILGNVLSAMAGKNINAKAAYSKATQVQFQFEDVQVIGVDPFLVGNYLESGTLAAGNAFVKEYVLDHDSRAFVVTEVLKADSITVIATKDGSTGINIDVPILQQVAGGSLGIDSSSAATGQVTYKGPKMLTFGFKIFQIEFTNGNWAVHGTDPGQGTSLAFTKGNGKNPKAVLLVSTGLLDFALPKASKAKKKPSKPPAKGRK